MTSESTSRGPSKDLRPLRPPQHDDDRAGHLHRQTIGVLGAALAPAVVLVDRLRPTAGVMPVDLDSISAYYYSAAVVLFVGILACLTVYLLTYEGYGNPAHWLDRVFSWVAAVSALLLIFFPTDPPTDAVSLSWWRPYMGWVHNIGAGALFVAFIALALLFTKSDAPVSWTSPKGRRNLLYIACGLGMAAACVSAVVSGLSGGNIFWQETIALELFAASWLVKGKTLHTARALLERGAHYTRHPQELIEAIRRAARPVDGA